MASGEFVRVDNARHDLKHFDCGRDALNTFLTRFAARDQKLGISATWVLPVQATSTDEKASVRAYYTLCSAHVRREEVPAGKLPPYDLPVVLLAKMAVRREEQGQRLGEKTLVHALRQAAALTDNGLPAIGLVLDVLDEDALAFYQRFDFFAPFTDDPMRLYVPMASLREL